jgi:peptidoglycan/LPS O-acetylase OafA/YrhL
MDRELLRFSEGMFELVLFPLTIITPALWKTRRGTLGRRFALLGDIGYSTYLLHFSPQMVFMLAAFKLGVAATFFNS